MNFLAPLFLLGAAAIIGPIIFHLIRRTTREKTPFSTLMFLEPTPPRITRRSRLENLWLLLLRCLILALLALAFARPFFRQSVANAASARGKQRAVILLDTSASLRREGLWDEAVKKVIDRVHQSSAGDELALLSFDRSVRSLMTFEDWNRLQPDERGEIISKRLSTISPTWAGTNLDAALIRAAELLDAKGETEPTQRKIIVVSDLQEGASLDRLQGYEWPHGTSVEFVQVGKPPAGNVSIQWVPESEESQTDVEPQPLRLRVANSAGDKQEQFGIRWIGIPSSPEVPAYVPAGQSRIVRITSPNKEAETVSPATSLTINGDEVPFDNTVHLLPPQAVRIPILFLGKTKNTDPDGLLYYLDRAFPKTRSQNIEIIANESAAAVPAFQANAAQLIVLGESIGTVDLTTAREAAKAGRIVVLPLASNDSANVLAALLERPSVTVTEAKVKDYALFGEIDFQHPLFALFADPRFSDFTKIHFWRYRQLDTAALPEARVIAKFDRGDPAIVQIPLGRGSVVVLTSTWRPTDSQLALSSKFVPLLHALLEQSTDIPVTHAQYFVGDSFPVPTDPQGSTVRKPDGSEVRVESGEQFSDTDQPGIYTVLPANRRLVVNLWPEESRLTPLPIDRFTALGVPLQPPPLDPQTAANRASLAQAIELEGRQKAWRWLIVTALGVLLIETLIAGKLSGVNRGSTVPTP